MKLSNKTILIAALTTILILAQVSYAFAADSIGVVDQANVVDVRLEDSIQGFSPIGQSFTPMLSGLDVVELWTMDFDSGNVPGVELYVNIRQSTIDGPILGTSNLLQLPDNFSGETHFTFPSLVRLTPGELYVIEVVAVGSDWGIGSSGGPSSTYPGGTWIIMGVAGDNNDLWFREGLANTTPQSSDYCKKDLWASLSRADGSAFKNQGDCIQYVNTGK